MDDPRAAVLKFKRHMHQLIHYLHNCGLLFLGHIEQEETTAARTQKLSAQRTGCKRFFVQFVNTAGGNLIASLLLQSPALVQQTAEVIQIRILVLQNLLRFVHNGIHIQ